LVGEELLDRVLYSLFASLTTTTKVRKKPKRPKRRRLQNNTTQDQSAQSPIARSIHSDQSPPSRNHPRATIARPRPVASPLCRLNAHAEASQGLSTLSCMLNACARSSSTGPARPCSRMTGVHGWQTVSARSYGARPACSSPQASPWGRFMTTHVVKSTAHSPWTQHSNRSALPDWACRARMRRRVRDLRARGR
jgi:hypothetical protein